MGNIGLKDKTLVKVWPALFSFKKTLMQLKILVPNRELVLKSNSVKGNAGEKKLLFLELVLNCALYPYATSMTYSLHVLVTYSPTSRNTRVTYLRGSFQVKFCNPFLPSSLFFPLYSLHLPFIQL